MYLSFPLCFIHNAYFQLPRHKRLIRRRLSAEERAARYVRCAPRTRVPISIRIRRTSPSLGVRERSRPPSSRNKDDRRRARGISNFRGTLFDVFTTGSRGFVPRDILRGNFDTAPLELLSPGRNGIPRVSQGCSGVNENDPDAPRPPNNKRRGDMGIYARGNRRV